MTTAEENQELMNILAETIKPNDVMNMTIQDSSALVEACVKYLRFNGVGVPTSKTEEEVLDLLIEKIANVEVCLEFLHRQLNEEYDIEDKIAGKLENLYDKYYSM